MDDVAKILINKWKTIIESIFVEGFSKKVESVDLFQMNNYYNGYPEIEYCYKVTFDFGLVDVTNLVDYDKTEIRKSWNNNLENTFIDLFSGDYKIDEYQSYIFASDKVDYMTNQGYRFIVQFYPEGFISELRDDKLKELGI